MPWAQIFEMEVTLIFTNGLKTQTRMFLDASAGRLMKNKIVIEIHELIYNMSLNEYRSQGNDRNVVKKKELLKLETQDALLRNHKLHTKVIEEIAKKLEAQEVVKLSATDIGCIFCEQAHETGTCLIASLGLYEEQVKYMGVVARKQRYPSSNIFNSGWPTDLYFFFGESNNFEPSQATN